MSLTALKLSWYGGFFEGRGWVNTSNGNLMFGVNGTDGNLLKQLSRELGGSVRVTKAAGINGLSFKKRTLNKPTKVVYRWCLTGSKARELLVQLIPVVRAARAKEFKAAIIQ